MTTLEELLSLLKDSPVVKRFRELEDKVGQNPTLIATYNDLVSAQKRMVQARERKSDKYQLRKQEYETLLEQLTSHILMNEYLETIEIINEDILFIQQIIEQEINTEQE